MPTKYHMCGETKDTSLLPYTNMSVCAVCCRWLASLKWTPNAGVKC